MSSPRHVRALDGLRAAAVVLVLLFHLRIPGFSSGFLGVDIFFVLSGFLITSLLITEHDKSGRVSLPVFWSRRIRRLMPALAVLLIVTALVTARTATLSEKESMRGDLLATTFYVANWHFVSESDYFNNEGTESPLEHTWSLAIEEQFYFFWPITVFALLLASRRWPRAPLAGTTLAAGISAALLAIFWAPEAVERAYMGTDSRVFEPLLGALAALLLRRAAIGHFVTRRGPAIEAAAVVAIAVGVAVVARNPDSYFTYGALFVSIATACLVTVLWSASGGTFQRALEPRPVAWVGALSYGIYLWHWPFIVWLGVRSASGADLLLRVAAAVALTLAVSSASYYLVERPIRSGRATPHLPARRIAIGVPVLLAGVAVVSILGTRTVPPAAGTPVILLTGDSVPQRLTSFLERAGADRGWFVVSAARGGCPVTGDHIVYADGSPLASGDRCPAVVRGLQASTIDRYDPDVVVWWDRFSIADLETPDGRHVRAGTDEFWQLRRSSLDGNVERLRRGGAVVALVGTEPPGENIWSRCSPRRCNEWIRRMIDHYDDLTSPWNKMMEQFAASHPGHAAFVSITDTVCRHDESPCEDRINGKPARDDGTHYVDAGAALAANALLDELAPLLPAEAVH